MRRATVFGVVLICPGAVACGAGVQPDDRPPESLFVLVDSGRIGTDGGGSSDQLNRLYRNTTSERTRRSWRSLRLRAHGPNTAGWGAKVIVGGDPGTGPRRWTRWHNPVTGYASQTEPVVQVGLGRAEQADSVIVHWPSGAVDVHTAVRARTVWDVTGGGGLEPAR